MKKLLLLLAAAGVCQLAAAQPSSGRIQYEVTQKVDASRMRVVMNGQEVRPGSPDFPADIPDVRTFGMTLSFAGGYAKEERENNAVRTIVTADGAGGAASAPQTTSLGRPFDEAVYTDLTKRTFSTLLTVKKDDVATTYRADEPFPQPSGWQLSEQTKKIAGYTCRKATVPFRKETYTVWYTTDLPFTYSPIKELVPEKGVVLAVEGSREQFRASKVDAKPVAESEVRPSAQARQVSVAELQEVREKARADFRQRMLDNLGNR
ncbi:GLPGLI family protein [Hymenobacter sp. B81]|uniref:GLPGLI family protein n=1 Tax=Hymenobacter sp. B81 TaxID=3344878 RepID=UPI0037DCEBEC